tara:strand:- start:2320 stop:4716 length:2397 start_codon:yes stop_codon:yes gene_type:complete
MIEYPMPGGGTPPDLFKGFREELANIEKVQQQEQARVLEMASMIEQADQSTMFGGDYSEAQQMAEWMTDHLDDFAGSTEGLIEFQQMTQQLSNFIDASEAYKKQNFGSADGNSQAGTWLGWYQRNASGVNPYGDYIDERGARSYEMAYMGLQQSRDLQYDESGRPTLSNRGRVENAFMPQLGTNLNIADGYSYYDAKSEAFKNDHQNAEAAANWTRRQIAADPLMQRRVANLYLDSIKAQDPSRSQWTLDELMKNPELVQQAVNAYVSDASRAWEDRFGEEVESRADQIFSGGVTNQDVPTVVPGQTQRDTQGSDIIAISGGDTGNVLDMLGDYDDAMLTPTDQPDVENTGFDMLLNLSDPITSDFTSALTENERVIAMNVDQFGNIHIQVEALVPDVPEGLDASDGDFGERTERSTRMVSASSDPDLHASLVNYLTPDLYAEMLGKSEVVAIAARRRRINERFENAKTPDQRQNQNEQNQNEQDQSESNLTDLLPENQPSVPGFGYLSDASGLDIPQEVLESPYFAQRLEDLGYKAPDVNPSQGALGALGRGVRSGIASVIDFLVPGDYRTAEGRQKDIIRQAAEETIRYLQNPEGMSPGMADMQAQDEVSRPSNEPTRDELRARLTEEQRAAYDSGGGVAVLTNNPGNLRPFEGYDGPVYINPKDNSPFQVFDTPQEGLDALEKDLKVKREGGGAVGKKMQAGTLPSGARTPDKITMYDIISVYAPFIENDPVAYSKSIAAFAKSMGYPEISPSTPANQVPLKLLMEAIIKVESGENYNLLSNAGLLPLSSSLALN